MTPPPIRYPLPTLVGLVLVGLLAWRGAGLARQARDAVVSRWRRAIDGPPEVESRTPEVIAGALTRKGLILRDGANLTARPGGTALDPIRRRMFVDLFARRPTAYRVGNRTPIGWVAADDCLEWDTRLALTIPGGSIRLAATPGGPAEDVSASPGVVPVVGWSKSEVEVAVWAEGHPWTKVARRGWTGLEPKRSALGVLLSESEVSALIRLAIDPDPAVRRTARLRAILGRVVEPIAWTVAEIEATEAALPAPARVGPSTPGSDLRLATRNASPAVDASWSGQRFRFVPMDDLP